MKNAQNLINRYIILLLVTSVCMVLFNFALLIFMLFNDITESRENRPWSIAKETANNLTIAENGYSLSETTAQRLESRDAWAILIDNLGNVLWNTENLPNDIPSHYTLSDISTLSRSYLEGYPTFTSSYGDGLIVLGYPKNSYWKLENNNWHYGFVKNAPITIAIFIIGNLLILLIIYFVMKRKYFISEMLYK